MLLCGKFGVAARVALAGSTVLMAASVASARPHRGAASRARGHRPHLHLAYAAPARVIQCVAFVKQDAGIVIAGNARDWWGNAAGVYQRGYKPEGGAVLSFMANSRMPLGHVAVVSAVEDGRTIFIDQSHWNSRGVTRDIAVKDVSENNDWTAVRVQLGRGEAFGSIYPTHGFIYPRSDSGVMVANVTRTPMPSMDEAPADLRRRHAEPDEVEVAEAPTRAPRPYQPLDLTVRAAAFTQAAATR